MTRTLLVETRDVYGVSRIYPVNKTAEQFAALIGHKTFAPSEIRAIIALGFDVETVTRKLDLRQAPAWNSVEADDRREANFRTW